MQRTGNPEGTALWREAKAAKGEKAKVSYGLQNILLLNITELFTVNWKEV